MFRKSTKRVISLVLCVLMLVACSSVAFAAVTETTELQDVRNRFRVGEGPKASNGMVTEYQFAYPIESIATSDKKYPVVFMIGETTTEDDWGKELRETSFPLWASAKYQKRFANAGGAYIVIVRPEPVESYLNGLLENESSVRNSLKDMITDFLNKHADNVDTSRVSVVTWGSGSKIATRLVAETPELFSALVLLSPTYEPSGNELTNLADVPLWLFACEKDTVSSFATFGTKLWDGIRISTSHTYVSRYTTFKSFNETKGKDKHHETWEAAAYDMHYTGEHSGMKTIDAENRTITFENDDEGMISWLSNIGVDHTEGCPCTCHGSDDMLQRILWFFKWMISMMLKIEKNRMCECGVAHW